MQKPVNAQLEKPLRVSRAQIAVGSLPFTCSPCMLGARLNIESDKTTSIHKVRLTEAVSSLGNGPRFVSQTTMHSLFSVACLQSFLAHTRLCNHRGLPQGLPSVCSSSATSDTKSGRALASLVPGARAGDEAKPSLDGSSRAMSAIFISGQSKLFRYSVFRRPPNYTKPLATNHSSCSIANRLFFKLTWS